MVSHVEQHDRPRHRQGIRRIPRRHPRAPSRVELRIADKERVVLGLDSVTRLPSHGDTPGIRASIHGARPRSCVSAVGSNLGGEEVQRGRGFC